MKNKNGVRIITLTALFVALTVVLGNIVQIPLQSRQFNLGFLPTALAAYLLGIPSAVAVGALGDIIGALLFPTGAFFPGFTLTAALVGLAYGVMLHGRKGAWLRVIIAMLLGACINLFLNSYWLSILYTSKGFLAWVGVRVMTYVPELPIQIILTGLAIRAVEKIPLPDWLKKKDEE